MVRKKTGFYSAKLLYKEKDVIPRGRAILRQNDWRHMNAWGEISFGIHDNLTSSLQFAV